MILLFGFFYWLFSIVTIVTAGTNRKIRSFAKPATMPLLAVFYISGTLQQDVFPKSLVLAALAFSTIGDLLLLKQSSKKFFLAGLFAFLTGHIAYTAYFFATVRAWDRVFPLVWAAPVLYLGASLFILKLLSGSSRIMKIPVVIYMIIICGMNFSTLLRLGNFSGAAFILPFLGSFFYMVSDTLLGVRNFKKRIPHISKVISITYHLAQFMIVFGILRA